MHVLSDRRAEINQRIARIDHAIDIGAVTPLENGLLQIERQRLISELLMLMQAENDD